MPDVGRRETFAERASGKIPTENASDLDPATLLAAARSVRRGAWWRAVRREGWTRAPGVARAFGILAVLACLAAGGGVSLPCPLGLFRGGEIREGAVDRERGRTGPLSPSGMEIDAMRAMKMSAAVIGVALSGSGALAQNAVEWKVREGGNGHWYAITPESGHWFEIRALCESRGAHMATFTSKPEFDWVKARLNVIERWVGGYQDLSDPAYQEPFGGWHWVISEPFTNPAGGIVFRFDDCPGGSLGSCGCGRLGAQNFLFVSGYQGGTIDDVGELTGWGCDQTPIPGIIEWEEDCNGDGVVDYGQILSGELADANANNIPDCCEQGTGCPANIVTNGSFEAGTPLNACSSESVTAGNSIGTGWQVTSGSVQRVRASSTCAAQGTPKFGDFFVDLLDAGEIRQAVATTPGRSYRLTFWLSGDCAGGPTTKRVTASLGTAMQSFDHACSGNGTQAWRSCSLEFIANSAITTLSLKSAAGGATNGPLVDGVRVEDISISCPGDVDGDGSVTGGDVSLVLLNFGDCPSN